MKKIISLIMALLMVLAVFVSCGTEPNDDGESTTDATITEGDTTVVGETTDKADEATTAGATTDAATTGSVTTAPAGESVAETTEIEETTEPYEEPLVMKAYDISNFKIVYAEEYFADIANALKDDILELTGVTLEVALDSGEESGENEIIIGKANRDISSTCSAGINFKYNACVGVYCEDGKAQMLGLERITLRESLEYFVEKVLVENSDKVSLPEIGALYEKISYESVDIPVKADESYIRVMTNNILMFSLSDGYNRPANENRMSLLMGAYTLLEPDIVGFQECDQLWETREGMIEKMASIGYSIVTMPSGRNNVPIYYKTERFTLVASGKASYDTSSLGSGYEARSYTWACLQEKDTGKQFVIFNTHLIAGWTSGGVKIDSQSDKAYAYRNESARQLVALVEQMKKTYPDAVAMVMGDLNSRLDSEVYSILSAAMLSSRDTAEVTANMKYETTCNLSSRPARSNTPKVIDHIFYSKDSFLTAKHYEVVVSKYSYAYSDHVPVVVDFAVN